MIHKVFHFMSISLVLAILQTLSILGQQSMQENAAPSKSKSLLLFITTPFLLLQTGHLIDCSRVWLLSSYIISWSLSLFYFLKCEILLILLQLLFLTIEKKQSTGSVVRSSYSPMAGNNLNESFNGFSPMSPLGNSIGWWSLYFGNKACIIAKFKIVGGQKIIQEFLKAT